LKLYILGGVKEMKKALALIMVLMLLLTACNSKGETAEKATANALKAIKAFDKEAIGEYLDYNELVDSENEDESQELAEKQAKKILGGLEYKIISSEENKDKAVVKVEITNTNIGKVIKDMMGDLFSLAMSEAFKSDSEKMTDEQMEQKSIELFDEALSKNKDEKITSTVDIKLNKVEGKWKIDMDSDLQNAIMGDLLKATEEMKDSFTPNN